MADAVENNNDLPAHVDSYGRFITWFKNGAIAVAFIVAVVVTIIVVTR
ncbi:aa3-type cytochrome c oxidase subunit IV [Sphingomonas paeninsulae]|uniref:Aa3-type cytochrome c oxidase subunit IV n=1 Tax=Sphingomonas paeninsulae TaxID=2319844 RepID=A0A494TL05_SPHPE|nr:aa3-type cytochrome c oxidase subunit IV [Sphingomonas paeninsulae]